MGLVGNLVVVVVVVERIQFVEVGSQLEGAHNHS